MKTLINPNAEQFHEFFDDCDIVMSAPNVAFLVGEHAVLRGRPAVVVTMPTRVYVGIIDECSSGPWLTIRVPDSEGGLRDVHVKEDPQPVGPRHLRAFVGALYGQASGGPLIAKRTGALGIRALSEVMPGSGADWSGAYSSALAACVHFHIVQDEFNADTIDTELEHWKEEDKWETSDAFTKINQLAFFLETAFHDGIASGYGTVVSLLGPTAPVVYMTCARSPNGPPYTDVYSLVARPLDAADGTREVIRRLDYIAGTVQLVPLTSEYHHLMHVAVVDTHKAKDAGTSEAVKRVLIEVTGDLEEASKAVAKNLGLRDLPSLGPAGNIWHALDYYALAFTHFFERSLTLNKSEFVPKAIHYMNSVGDMLLSLGLGWREFTDLSTTVWSTAGVNRSNTAVKLSGGGMGGVCTLVSTELDYHTLKEALGGSDRILYSSDMLTPVQGLRLHKLREAWYE